MFNHDPINKICQEKKKNEQDKTTKSDSKWKNKWIMTKSIFPFVSYIRVYFRYPARLRVLQRGHFFKVGKKNFFLRIPSRSKCSFLLFSSNDTHKDNESFSCQFVFLHCSAWSNDRGKKTQRKVLLCTTFIQRNTATTCYHLIS